MRFSLKKFFFEKRLWPGYLLIGLGILGGLEELFAFPDPQSWILFFFFLGIGATCIVLQKDRQNRHFWIGEIGILMIIGSLGYLFQAVHLASIIPEMWGYALSILLIRFYFRWSHLPMLYFLAAFIFLYSTIHILATQFQIENNLNGALFIFGFGLSFLYLYALAPSNREQYWSLFAGILLTPLGLFLLSFWSSNHIIQIVSAIELILIGIWLILLARASREKSA